MIGRGERLLPTGFDGEPDGVHYADDDLDRRFDQLLAVVAAERGQPIARDLDNVVLSLRLEPGLWAQVRGFIDELVVREEKRRLLLDVNVRAVAAAQRAQVEALTSELDDPEAGGSPGWREATVEYLVAHLAADEELATEERQRWERVRDAGSGS